MRTIYVPIVLGWKSFAIMFPALRQATAGVDGCLDGYSHATVFRPPACRNVYRNDEDDGDAAHLRTASMVRVDACRWVVSFASMFVGICGWLGPSTATMVRGSLA